MEYSIRELCVRTSKAGPTHVSAVNSVMLQLVNLPPAKTAGGVTHMRPSFTRPNEDVLLRHAQLMAVARTAGTAI